VEEAKAWGKRVAAHARFVLGRQAVRERQGIESSTTPSFTDNEALDLLEAHKTEHSSRPAWPG